MQIDDDTRKRLFSLKLELEKERGKPISCDEVIEYLLNNIHRSSNRAKHLKEFKKLRGSLPKDALNLYLEEKKKDLERKERMAPLNDEKAT